MIILKRKTKRIQKVFKELKKNEEELGEFCINKVADALKENGYNDAKLWATNILAAMAGDFDTIEESSDLEDWLIELEGPERSAVEAMYEVLSDLEDSVRDAHPEDVKDALIYSILKTIDNIEKNKYKRLYG